MVDGVIKQVEAAGILLLNTRQIRRIVKKVNAEGQKGIIHKFRGRDSNRKTPKEIRERGIKLYRTQYKDFDQPLPLRSFMKERG